MSNLAADKREKRLRNLANILSKHDRSDMVLTMGPVVTRVLQTGGAG